jgi:hypothetical protein
MKPLPELPALSLSTLPKNLVSGADGDGQQICVAALERTSKEHMDRLVAWVIAAGEQTEPPHLRQVAATLFEHLQALGLVLLALFLGVIERRVEREFPVEFGAKGRRYKRRPPQARNLMTRFGVLRYWRRYYRCKDLGKRGIHPTDVLVGQDRGRTTLTVSSLLASLATEMSFEKARASFVRGRGFGPSARMMQTTVQSLGAYAEEYFKQAPVPEGDGDFLIVQIDAKGVPMVTDEEMKKRRGTRQPTPHPGSARHRGRARRKTHNRKSRHPEPGTEHKKNARMATVIVLYTLRRNGDVLEGPINKIVWTTFGSKREAFELARREAVKRGFDPEQSDKIQLLTDGDLDYARFAEELFPRAIHTIDLMHVLEYVWDAAKLLFVHHNVQKRWATKQKKRLLNGHLDLVLRDLSRDINRLTRKGEHQTRLRELKRAYNYLNRRADLLDYKWLREHDLELATGAAEGAVRHAIAMRFDQSPMRWLPERVQPLMLLRCININGSWDDFIDYVQERVDEANHRDELVTHLQASACENIVPLAA